MFMRFIAPATLLLATSLCCAQEPAALDVAERAVEPPIIIDSDSNQYDLRSGLTRFSDNVRIQRGAMEVRADEGVVHQSDGRYTLIELFGSPTTWRDRLDDGTIVEGRASQIRYDVVDDVVTLSGDARLKHEQGEFTGDELVYDLNSESLVGRGSSGNQARVILEGDSMRRAGSDGESEPGSEANDDPPADDGEPEATATEATATEAAGAEAAAEGDAENAATGAESATEQGADEDEPQPVDPPASR